MGAVERQVRPLDQAGVSGASLDPLRPPAVRANLWAQSDIAGRHPAEGRALKVGLRRGGRLRPSALRVLLLEPLPHHLAAGVFLHAPIRMAIAGGEPPATEGRVD